MLYEYRFLIPHVRNSDRTEHLIGEWSWLTKTLCDEFGGYTSSGFPVNGAWKDNDGSIVRDGSTEYRVALDNRDLAKEIAFFDTLTECCKRFDQECIYCVDPDNGVTFVDRNFQLLEAK